MIVYCTLTTPTIIILGKEVVTDSIPIKLIRPSSPTPTNTNSYPLEPLLSSYDRPLPPLSNTQSRLANAQDTLAEISNTEIKVIEVIEKLL